MTPPRPGPRWNGRARSDGGQAFAGRGRVTDEGEDHPEVPRFEIHREGFDGARPRSAEVEARSRREAPVQARLQGAAGEEEGPGRAQASGGEGRVPLHR